MPVGLRGSNYTEEVFKMTTHNGRHSMHLYSNMNDYEHLPSSCVARSCSLRISRLQVFRALEQDLKAMVICVAMQGSRRSLRSDQLPVQPSGTMDAELDLLFTLQYPHFLKRRENDLQITLQRRKKYKTRTILGYKTLAIGHINMAQVLQGWYSNHLHLYTKDNKEPAATLSITSLTSEPIDRDIQDRRNTMASMTEPLNSTDDDDDSTDTDVDVDSAGELDAGNRIPSGKIKKKFLKRFFNKLRVADADLVGDVQKELQKGLRHDINDEEEDEDFSFDEDDDDSDNDILEDNLSIPSMQKPGLRPYFDQSQSQTALNQTTMTKKEADALSQALASVLAGKNGEKDTSNLPSDNNTNSSESRSIRFDEFPNFTKNSLRSVSFREKRSEKQQLKRKSSVDIPKVTQRELPSENFTNQLSRVLDNDDKIPDYIMMVDMKDDMKQEKNLNLKLISVFDSIVCTAGRVEVQAAITGIISKFQKFCNRHSVSPPPLCVVVFGAERYLRNVLESYVEQFGQKPQYQSFVKFLVIPFGSHRLASYIAHVDRKYCSLFSDNFWNTIVDQAIISDTDLKEIERRVRYYIDNSDIVQSLPIAEALVTRKSSNGESSQCFIPFITEVRVGSGSTPDNPYDTPDGETASNTNALKDGNGSQNDKTLRDGTLISPRYDITDAKLFSNETQDLLVDYWPLPNSQVPVTKKEEKKEGNKLSIKSSFKSLVVSRIPTEENEDVNGLLISANIKSRNKGVKRLMNKKDKDGESKNTMSVVVSKIVCTARSSGHTFSDEPEVRNLVVWLEDKKIRFYQPNEREPLRDTESKYWIGALKKYLKDLNCPVENLSHKLSVITWLVNYALEVEYQEKANEYNKASLQRETLSSSDDFLNTLSSDDPHFKDGVESLQKLLRIPCHPDSLVVLQAIAKLVQSRLSEDATQQSNKNNTSSKAEYLSLSDMSLGFNTKDNGVNEAAKIIRLLQIHNLRELQTYINEAIVNVQRLSANPKTDQSLGKVGR